MGAGSVRHQSAWFDLPFAPEHRIKLRPLAQRELLDVFAMIPDGYDAGGDVPKDAAQYVLVCGLIDWTFQTEDGEPLECTEEEIGFLDGQTWAFALGKILEMSVRSPGEGTGSGTPASTTRRRRS